MVLEHYRRWKRGTRSNLMVVPRWVTHKIKGNTRNRGLSDYLIHSILRVYNSEELKFVDTVSDLY